MNPPIKDESVQKYKLFQTVKRGPWKFASAENKNSKKQKEKRELKRSSFSLLGPRYNLLGAYSNPNYFCRFHEEKF